MRPIATSQVGCMGPATALLYEQQWGVPPIIGTCFGQDGYQWFTQDPNNPQSINIDPD
jgi:hypothetical protein